MRPPQTDAYQAKLEKLAKALNEEVPDAKYDNKNLVQLIVSIANFQEDALGRKVRGFSTISSRRSRQVQHSNPTRCVLPCCRPCRPASCGSCP